MEKSKTPEQSAQNFREQELRLKAIRALLKVDTYREKARKLLDEIF